MAGERGQPIVRVGVSTAACGFTSVSFMNVAPDDISNENRMAEDIKDQQGVFLEAGLGGFRRPFQVGVIDLPYTQQEKKRAAQRLHIPQRKVEIELRHALNQLVFGEKKREGNKRKKKEYSQIVKPVGAAMAGGNMTRLRDCRTARTEQTDIN